MKLTVHFDGGARPTNPGHGAYGVVIKNEDGVIVNADKMYLGPDTTNNEAEWRGMLKGLHLALETPGVTAVDIVGDSNLVISQINGDYSITSKRLFAFKKQHDAMRVAHATVPVTYRWVPREENVEADALVNTLLEGVTGGASKKVDGRKTIFNEMAALLGGRVEKRFPWLRNPHFSARGISFYSKLEADQCLPSVERRIWEEIEAENRLRPVLLGYRPYGNRVWPLSTRYHGDPTGHYREVRDRTEDKGIELMLAFADTLVAEEAPAVKRTNFERRDALKEEGATPEEAELGAEEEVKLYGYRGSLIMVLRGTWIPARELAPLLRYEEGREVDPLGEGSDGYRIGG